MNEYAGKRILVGVTGSIAAFKVAGWVSTLVKAEAEVTTIMTEAAARFVTPLTFAALTGRKVHTDMFDHESGESMAHILLGREADLVIVAPASAQTLARLAHGMASDLLSTTVLASKAPVVLCPAMNPRMYEHPATQENLKKLAQFGYQLVEPGTGAVACREDGRGRLPEWEQVDEFFRRLLSVQDLAGKKILITAGPTREPIDPARFISNRSSGKMGYWLARTARRRGAEVVLVSGPTSLASPVDIEVVRVQTALEMAAAVQARAGWADVIIKAAAVADHRPMRHHDQKVKKEQLAASLEMLPNPDILRGLGKDKRGNQLLVGFAAESDNLEEEGRRKLAAKNLDLIAVNDIGATDEGFEVDNNRVLLIDHQRMQRLPHTSKEQTAQLILDRVVALLATVAV